MIDWLTEKGIPCSHAMTKIQLYEIIKSIKQQHRQFKINTILEAHGHTALRLPPYHPELNPIEMIWGIVKNYVASQNVTFNLEDARKLAEEKFNQINEETWNKVCDHVKSTEQKFWENEHVMDIITDSLVIHVKNDSSDSDFGFGFSDSDNDD